MTNKVKTRYLEFPVSLTALLAVGILKLYGVLSKPFKYKWLAWIGVFVGKFVNSGVECSVMLEDDAKFRFYLGDYYWNKLVCKGFRYEPEIEFILKKIIGLNYCFLDLGANYGYWSVLVTSKNFGKNRAIAVEPVQSNYYSLKHNNHINGDRFTTVNFAVAATGGQTLDIHTHRGSLANEGATLVSNSQFAGPDVQSIDTITIDQIIQQQNVREKTLVIKLDVEGYEIEALKGANSAICKDMLLIYEDHGSDLDCKISEYVLGMGMAVFHMECGRLIQIKCLDEVKAIKQLPNKGYNLFSCRHNTKIFSTITDNL